MTVYTRLVTDKIQALKDGNTQKRQVLAMIVAQIKNAMIEKLMRGEPPEDFVNQQLTKYMKQLQETKAMIPADRVEELNKVLAEIEIVKEYAPKLITDADEIKKILDSVNLEFIPTNRGRIMKEITAQYKGKIDMKAVNEVLAQLMK